VQWGGAQLGATSFPTTDGKAHFSVVSVPRVDVPLGQFLLTTRRGKQFNSMTYGGADPLTRGQPRDAILLDQRDWQALGIREGERVRVTSTAGTLEGTAGAGPCRRGHAQAFWPECNSLLGRKYDPASGEPDYNTAVKIERATS
jgi:anaerobic selenocysteine-containing dehydrogenase